MCIFDRDKAHKSTNKQEMKREKNTYMQHKKTAIQNTGISCTVD